MPYAGTKKCKRPLIPIHFKSSSLTNILLIIISNPIIYFHLLITLWFCHTFCQHCNYIWSFKSWLLGRKSQLIFWNLSLYWIVHLLTTYKPTICQSAQVIIHSHPFPFEFFGSVKFFTQWNLTFSIHLPSTLYLWPTQTSFAQMVFSSTISYFVSFTICRWWWWWGSNRFPRFHSMILISSNPQLVQPTRNCCKTALILFLCWTTREM